ncbi:hypothetical protein EYC84_005921 [Monilinia fructicola]|uniref:Uncharacterized protein n=1 Tax=Monilinia fructicola TaxID=38448 RepID=A0A5M9K0N3_MONFR|nr:hypothetical protein EYC84_005921 [Monilinia fructicola]
MDCSMRFSLLFSLRLVSSRLVSFDLTSFSSLVLVIFMDFPFLPSLLNLSLQQDRSAIQVSPLLPRPFTQPNIEYIM